MNDPKPYCDFEEEEENEAAELFCKIDSEGGLQGFLDWGGVAAFPKELQPAAVAFRFALRGLEDAVAEWGLKHGVTR